jgi:hypothetical protein
MGGVTCYTKLLNIAKFVQEITKMDNPTTSSKDSTQYYVEMSHSLVTRALELNEPTTSLNGFTKVGLK